MMVFNSFTAANNYYFGAQMTKRLLHFLADKMKLFEGVCVTIGGKCLQKEL